MNKNVFYIPLSFAGLFFTFYFLLAFSTNFVWAIGKKLQACGTYKNDLKRTIIEKKMKKNLVEFVCNPFLNRKTENGAPPKKTQLLHFHPF